MEGLQKICYDVELIHNAILVISRSLENLDAKECYETSLALELIAGWSKNVSDSLWDYYDTQEEQN